MSSRRSRPPRSRKSRTSDLPQGDAAVAQASAAAQAPKAGDPTQTSQLRALEAGWDELLG